MAFQTPSLSEIWTGVKNAMRTYLPGTDAWVEPNNLSVVGRSFSLAVGSVYERINYLYRQLFASSADGYHLEFRHAFEYGINRKAAAPGQGFISFTQTGTAVTIPSGYTVTAPNGVVYSFLTPAVPNAATKIATVEVRATTNGAITNQLPSTPMTFATDIAYPSLPATATVGSNGIGGGADIEGDEDLRARVLFRKRNPPHGGARSDYERWATEVPGVTRVFISPFQTVDGIYASALTIYPLFDDTRANGVPTTSDCATVAAYIDPLRPVTARVYVLPPTPVAVNVQITGLKKDTVYIREAIKSNLAAMFLDQVPVVTAENGFTLPVAWIDAAISRAEGYDRHTLSSPASDVTFATGSIPVLGTVSFS